jgi:hypothetical protein
MTATSQRSDFSCNVLEFDESVLFRLTNVNGCIIWDGQTRVIDSKKLRQLNVRALAAELFV